MNEPNGQSRLDRIELGLEKLVGVVQQLAGELHQLADHVGVLADHVGVLAGHVGLLTDHTQATNALLLQTAEEQLKLAAAQNETEDRLNALIKSVDGLIRNPPAPGA